MKDNTELKNFFKNGFFKKNSFFDTKFIENLNNEILEAKDVDRYFDKNNVLRRIEKLYDKGKFLKILNSNLLIYLNEFFNKNFVIFKDKYNAKPVGGEGFEPHYDGIFYFEKKDNTVHKGWYKYSNFFVNVLVALDYCNSSNGTIEIANADFDDFENLIENTKKNGTPILNKNYASSLNFQIIDLEPGDILFFSNLCPHKSNKNNSKNNRRTLYYTYAESDNEDIYNEYFRDKKDSISSKGGAL